MFGGCASAAPAKGAKVLNVSDQASSPTVIPADQAIRTYVVDTSVLLSDPRAMLRFAEHNVVLPIVVITIAVVLGSERLGKPCLPKTWCSALV